MGRVAGMPMGQSPYRKTETSDHTIHSDGTYSNDLSVVEVKEEKPKTIRERLKKNVVLQFGVGPSTWSGVVHKITDKGVYCRPSLHEEVDLSRCTFYNWEEIETQTSGIA